MDRVSVSSPVPSISLNVIERLVTVPENAPTAHPITPITRGQLLNTDFGPGPSSATQITIRRRQDSAPEPSNAEQLAPLQFAAAMAEATARETAALEAAAISRRNIQLLDIETRDLARRSTSAGSRSSSGSPHRQRSPRDGSPSELGARSPRQGPSPPSEVATLLQLFADQRREDRREAAEQRREDRREAAEREARLEARLLQAPSTNSGGYRIGTAAKEFRPFEGKEDGAAYILEFTHLLGTHEVPVAHWPRELSLKLKGSAANWYMARFPDLPAGTFPLWSELHAAMLHAYSQSYGAAGAYQNLHSLRRLPGSTGKETYARVEELSMLLRRKGVSNPGQEEQNAYILQNQLTAGESARWISLANADEKISDAALNALELGAADARTGRLSCPPSTREAFFAARREHLRNFLTEQGPAPTGDRSVGSSSARAAVSTGDDAAEPPAPPAAGVARAAVVARLQAHHKERGDDTARSAPLYYGTAKHPESIRNAAAFAERKTAQWCFGCTPKQLAAQGPIPHWECQHHGQDAY
jgi:hypothetical protein